MMNRLLLAILFAVGLGVTECRADPVHASDVFGAGKQAVSLSSGYGFGHELSGSEKDAIRTRTVPILPRWSIGVTDVLGDEDWYRGNVDVALEGLFLLNHEPQAGGAQGGNLFVRYNFLPFERVVPYFGIGAGLLNLDYDLDTQRDGFNFAIAGEVGLHGLVTDDVAVSGGYRLQHISNARTASPNLGVDTSFAILGLTYFLH